MRLKDIITGLDVRELRADPELDISDICYDSRKALPGTLFALHPGFETEGAHFFGGAKAKGAAWRRPPQGAGMDFFEHAKAAGASVFLTETPLDAPYILVENSRRALALACANLFGRPAERLRLVGVTGTNGKTTTTQLCRSILDSLGFDPCGLVGSNENIVGSRAYDAQNSTPEARELHALFAEMVSEGCASAVMEVSSHALALERVAGLRFAAGCFTNLGRDHLDFHETAAHYLASKARLFAQSDVAVLNADDPAAASLLPRIQGPRLTFGLGEGADLRAEAPELYPDRVEFTAVYAGRRVPARLCIPGRFSVYNGLAALACCLALGCALPDAAEALGRCKPVKGRMEVVPTGRDFTLLIDYAVTPDALENMLRAVRGSARGRVGVLFGCGGDRDRGKRPEMARVVAQMADYAIVTSDNPRTEDPEAIIRDILPGFDGLTPPAAVIPDRREAIAWAIRNAGPGDTLVLAGKGHETYQIIGKTKYHMDEREIVAEVLGR